ncbi:methyltransferase domain-containing protein [Actinoplanes sp. NPDC026619]|uniref:class I SAM-dependent methyltransferase n=1 Tax=Actinoplanes sp. NPDC026619 TaxID=3155798 RepID=UPI0033D98F84
MTPELLAQLRTPAGVNALTVATETDHGDPLAAASAVRSRGIPADLAAAALTQAELRRRAVPKFGAGAERMFFTRPGLEQATRAVVAERRAARLAAAGVKTMADLGCGLGSDAMAAARAGIFVYAVDSDPTTAAVAAANVAALGLDDMIKVDCADATTVRVEDFDAVFADPARRKAGRGRVFDPKSFSPPWDFVSDLATRVPRTVLKLAPGIDHALLPPGAEGEWVSVGGDLVEATFWCGPLASAPRRATLLPSGAELIGPGDTVAAVGPVGAFLYDPDPAVVRAHLVAEFAATIGGRLADPSIAYVYTDARIETRFGRRLSVTDVLPFSLKRLRALLRERGIGKLEIRKRGSALEPDQLRRDLKLAGPNGASLVLTRVTGAPTALLCEPNC